MGKKATVPELGAGFGLLHCVVSQLHELLHGGADAAGGQGQGGVAQTALTAQIHSPTVQEVGGSMCFWVVS